MRAKINIIFFFIFLLFTKPALAEEFEITSQGGDSQSNITVQVAAVSQINQTSELNIQNNITVSASTGNNQAKSNTGNVKIETGNVTSNISLENKANNSLVGNPELQSSHINSQISTNGSDSSNELTNNQTANNTVTIAQNATIINNIQGSANTGSSTASDNTGHIEIKTGNIKAIQNIENNPISTSVVTVNTKNNPDSEKVKSNGDNSINKMTKTDIINSNIFINQTANITNFSNWGLDSGHNSAQTNNGEVSIVTGDIFLALMVNNKINTNVATVSSECKSPIADPGSSTNPALGVSSDTGDSNHSDNNNQGPESSSPSPSSNNLGQSQPPQVLGLSYTGDALSSLTLIWTFLFLGLWFFFDWQ
jgi:hypothetical protein